MIMTKMKIMPMATPGRDIGPMISRKIWNGVAPMSVAASRISFGILAREKKIGPIPSTT